MEATGAQTLDMPTAEAGQEIYVSITLTDNSISTANLMIQFIDAGDQVLSSLSVWSGNDHASLVVDTETFKLNSGPNTESLSRNTVKLTLKDGVFTEIEVNGDTVEKDIPGGSGLVNATRMMVGFAEGWGSGVVVDPVVTTGLPANWWIWLLVSFGTIVVIGILSAWAKKIKVAQKVKNK